MTREQLRLPLLTGYHQPVTTRTTNVLLNLLLLRGRLELEQHNERRVSAQSSQHDLEHNEPKQNPSMTTNSSLRPPDTRESTYLVVLRQVVADLGLQASLGRRWALAHQTRRHGRTTAHRGRPGHNFLHEA